MAEPRIVRFEISGIPRPKPAGFADPTPNLVLIFDDGGPGCTWMSGSPPRATSSA